MYCVRHLATLFLFAALSRAAPRNEDNRLERNVPDDIPKLPRGFAVDGDVVTRLAVVTTTDYMTMPAGTYTEVISEGAIRVIVVNEPTTTSKMPCPAECDCTRITDKNSDEYFQCITNPNCRPCRAPGITSTSSTPTPTPTCPVYCDCSKFKDKNSDEYFQCVTNPNCRECWIGKPPRVM